MNHCKQCGPSGFVLPEAGTLCLAPPLSHTLGTIREVLKTDAILFDQPEVGILSIRLGPGLLRDLADRLDEALSRPELADTRSVLLPDDTPLGLKDLCRMQPLNILVDRVRGAWLPEMLADGRLTTHFQPIVPADRPDEPFAHECLLRGLEPDGAIIAPGVIYHTARGAELLFQLDRAARLTAIQEANRVGLSGKLFINFNPTAIYDPVFCLRSTIAAIAESTFSPGQVVFEVVESDQVTDPAHLRRIFEAYRESGFGIALDDLGAGYGSLNLLSELRPDFVKLDMQLIRGVDRDPYKALLVHKLLDLAHSLNIATVAEGIETYGEWEWVRENGADYVQGYLFARPASPPSRPAYPRRVAEAVAI